MTTIAGAMIAAPMPIRLQVPILPEIRSVSMLIASSGTRISAWTAGHAEPIRESGTPRPIKAI